MQGSPFIRAGSIVIRSILSMSEPRWPESLNRQYNTGAPHQRRVNRRLIKVVSTWTQNYKFEGKKRDTQTSNDDIGARYTFRLGRWVSG